MGPPPVLYHYASDYACPGASPTKLDNQLCLAAVNACTPPTGPLIVTWRQAVTNGVPGRWETVGTACDAAAPPPDTAPSTPQAPAAPRRPVLTMGMIMQAFHDTPFAVPSVHAQPEGNATLVRLPVYLELVWPAAGYEPGEVETVDPARMLGNTVRLKPVLQSASYSFGDGAVVGPTTSLGGPYPSGDIRHPYQKAGTYRASITATYTAQVSVNGSPYVPLPGTTTLTSPVQPITVKTATNQLVR